MNERVIGIGKAVVDEKIRDPSVLLPANSELFTFLEGIKNSERFVGGVTPNILAAITDFSSHANLRLVACIGNDSRGEYCSSVNPASLGPLQVHEYKQTAVSVEIIDDTGLTIKYGWNYGAADTVKVEKEDLEEKHSLIISDTTVLGIPNLFSEIDKVLKHPANKSAAFFLNLCGLPDLYSHDEVKSIFLSLRKQPDIIIGNNEEISYLSESINSAPISMLPNTRILITTLAEKGSTVRFEGNQRHIPAVLVDKKNFRNETGAGDVYSGIMLGSLLEVEYNQWSADHVIKSCKIASFGASLAVQSMDTRLSRQEMARVKRYHERVPKR